MGGDAGGVFRERIPPASKSIPVLALACASVTKFQVYELEVELHSVRAPSMKRITISEAGEVEAPLPPTVAYRGRVAGRAGRKTDRRLSRGYRWRDLRPRARMAPSAPRDRIVSFRGADLLAPRGCRSIQVGTRGRRALTRHSLRR